jgi:hypothetical protein
MADLNWDKIEAELRQQKPEKEPCPADEFWKEFKERAGDVDQDQEEPLPRVRLFPRWVAAAAALFVVGIGIWIMMANRPGPVIGPGPDPIQIVDVGETTEINSIEVFAPHEGTVILSEDPDQGTVLWIATADDYVIDEDNEL